MFEQAASYFPTGPSDITSDRYMKDLFNSVVAGYNALTGDKANAYNQVHATESRIKASEAADRTRRSQLLASALAEGQATEFNPQDPTQNMMLAYVYNIDRDIDKVARLTSMGQLSEARAAKEKIDNIVKDNFNLIYEMTNEGFSHLGPAGEQLRTNATRLTTSDVWAGTKVNVHGQETNVYDVLNEDGTSFNDMWAAEISNSYGAPAGELIKSDTLFQALARRFPKDVSPEFVSRISEADSNGSSIFGTAKGVFGSQLLYMTPQILDTCKQTGDAADVLDTLNIIGESLPSGPNRGVAALNAYKSLRNRCIKSSENGTEGGYVEEMKFNAALRATLAKFREGGKSIDLTNPSFQATFDKARTIARQCEAWGIPFHASGTSNGWSPNDTVANYVYDDLDGLSQGPNNRLASFETLITGISTGITGVSLTNPSYAVFAPKKGSDPVLHAVQKNVFQVVGKEISSEPQTSDQAFKSVLEEQDPDANDGSFNTAKAQELEDGMAKDFLRLGLRNPKAAAVLAESYVDELRSRGGQLNIESVGRNVVAELNNLAGNNPDVGEVTNAISSFLDTYYMPASETMTEQLSEVFASVLSDVPAEDVKRLSRFAVNGIMEIANRGGDWAREYQRLFNLTPALIDQKIDYVNANDIPVSDPDRKVSSKTDYVLRNTAIDNALHLRRKAELSSIAGSKSNKTDSVRDVAKTIAGDND